jgi:uncharacterized protein
MKTLALFAISAYQRHLSPRKGYGCAYRVHTGHRSCSALGYRAIRKYGLWPGLQVLRQRLARCGETAAGVRARRAQQGFCDLGCPCDLPSCDAPTDCVGAAVDGLDCLSCDCGPWGPRRRDDTVKPRA